MSSSRHAVMPQCVDCFFLNCHPTWGTTGRSPYIYMSSTADVRSLIWAWRISCHPPIHFTPPQQSPSPISPTPGLSSRTPSSDLLIDMSLNHSALSLVLVRLPPLPCPPHQLCPPSYLSYCSHPLSAERRQVSFVTTVSSLRCTGARVTWTGRGRTW